MFDMGKLKIAHNYISTEWIVREKPSKHTTEDFETTTGMNLSKLWWQGVV
jgi:hypothetical protein